MSLRLKKANLNLKEYLLEDSNISDQERVKISMIKIRSRGDTTKHKEKIVISREEFTKLYTKVKDPQVKLMLNLSYYCSLREHELISLSANNFNWREWELNEESNGKITFVGKRNKMRTVLVPNFVMIEASEFFKNRYANKNILPSEKIWRTSKRRWERTITYISERLLGYRISTHVFRRSFATYLYENGWDLVEISEHLGHADIKTTAIYTKISKKHLEDKYKEIVNKN